MMSQYRKRYPPSNANAVTAIYDRLREELAVERAKVDKLEKERDGARAMAIKLVDLLDEWGEPDLPDGMWETANTWRKEE